MKYIVFITTNKKHKINGINRIYIGFHETENPEIFDGYLGDNVYKQQASSFKYPKTPFQYAVKKYGTNAFERTIIGIYKDKKEAMNKCNELIQNMNNSDHLYNIQFNFDDYPIYQYDGTSIRKWDSIREASKHYNYPISRFKGAIVTKTKLLNSFWSNNKNDNNFLLNQSLQMFYLYTKGGRLIKEYYSKEQAIEDLNISDIYWEINNQTLIQGKYYLSNKLLDLYITKPRKQWLYKTFYVYKKDGSFVGEYHKKEIMRVIKLHSWNKIDDIFKFNNGLYEDFYISLKPIDKLPERIIKNTSFDIYTTYGDFIENIKDEQELMDKYAIKKHQVKRIKLGDKYCNDYIIKYNSK